MITADFTPVWEDPADAAKMWIYEPIHYGDANPPLMQEIQASISGGIGMLVKYVNGYCFVHNSGMPLRNQEIERRGPRAVWLEDCQPRVQAIVEKHRGTDYASMSAAELARALPLFIAEAGEAFGLTMVTFMAFLDVPIALSKLCERELGADGLALANALLQGYENVSFSDGQALEALAHFVALRPELEEALRDGRYDDMASVPGGAEFGDMLRAYLAQFGWRAQNWSLGHLPVAAEDPSLTLSLVRRYLDDDSVRPSTAHARAAAQRDEALQQLRSQLKGDTLVEFETLVASCRDYVAQSEERAFWQLTSLGSLRVPALALGARLVTAGLLDQPNDVYFFNSTELIDAVQTQTSLRDVAAARRADLERQKTLTPPPFIGSPAGSGPPPAMDGFFRYYVGAGGGRPAPSTATVTGMAASKGTVRGTARVLHDLTESERLQPGDILVCRTTAAPWTPLFAIAGGIVTDTGGILSHSAICAREYAIPAVVGTRFATLRIPDGATVVVDGDKGTVTVEA